MTKRRSTLLAVCLSAVFVAAAPGPSTWWSALDLYNLFNSNTATVYNEVFDVATVGATWRQPTTVLTARATRFNVQFDF